ncbi:MAG: AAA family ATPase [Clostridia bacterium]|nr:AAA family ATPase [Clostridia bacterium]
MARIYLVTSYKGGVGKSTVSANIANKLAKLGKKVLLCDLDFDLGTLDLLLGCEDRMLFDICDAVYGRADAESCTVKLGVDKNLAFLGAPYRCNDEIDPEYFASRIKELAKDYDYAILDTPGGNTVTLQAARLCSDEAIVVATQNPASIRGAEKTADSLAEAGISSRLVINCFDAQSAENSSRAGILSMIDSTKTPLLGVIPYDRTMMFAQEKGVLSDGDTFISSRAFENVVSRMEAALTHKRPVPVLYKVKGIRRKKVLTK